MRKCALRLALLLLCVPASCAGRPPVHVINAGEAKIGVSVFPSVSGEQNTIDVESDRAPVAAVALDMPDMRMPAKPYTLRSTGTHTYQAPNVNFSMAGTWRVSILDARGRRISSFTLAVR